MLTTREAIKSARHAMVDGNLVREDIPACLVAQWLDVIEESLKPDSQPHVDVWCDGWYKSCVAPELRMGYSFRVAVSRTVLPAHRGRLRWDKKYKKQPVNVAEYFAIIRALQWVKASGFQGSVTVHTDSQTVWGQITQAWNTNAHKFPQIGHLWAEASQLLDEVGGHLVKEPRLSVKAMLGH